MRPRLLPTLVLALPALVPAAPPEAEPVPAPPASSIDASLFVASGEDVRSFTLERTIAAPAERVWRAWTDGETFRATYDPARPELRAEIELAIGGRYEWLWDGTTGSNGCQVLAYLPERLLVFSWNAPPSQPVTRELRTWVVVELEPHGAGSTRVRLTHAGFGEGEAWDETRAYFQSAWQVVLERFATGLG